MAVDYLMPKLAMGMNEGTVIEWLVAEGQRIERGEPLMQVETEKVVYDVESPESGWFHIVVPAGKTVPVESVIGRFAASEEEYAAIGGAASAAGTEPPSPTARSAAQASVVAGAFTPATVPTDTGARLKSSPLARRLARERGIDLAEIVGSGPGGRIVKRDVLAWTPPPAPVVSAAAPKPSAGISVRGSVALRGMRGAIARRMVQSLQTSAQLSHFSEVDATRLLDARARFVAHAEHYGTRVSINAFVVKAIALACQAVPIANASVVGEEILLWNEVNVGLAVAVPGQGEWDSGLIVPVVRNVERKGLVQIDTELRDLSARAREGRLQPGETEGGTITLSPTSAIGGEDIYSFSTPVLNLPQAVIVQPGMIMQRAVVEAGSVVVRPMMPLSLSFDHRILDGEPFARFVAHLRRCLHSPELMLA